MYKVVEKKKAKKVTPHYSVTFSYMIGDGDAYTDKKSEFYENEFDEVIQKSIHVLKEFSMIDLRKYGLSYFCHLDLDHLKVILENELMSEEERNILSVIFLSREGDDNYDDLIAYWSDYIPSTLTREVFEKEYKKYTQVWDDFNLMEEGDLGYYSLQGVEVVYVDENGTKHEVNWVEED